MDYLEVYRGKSIKPLYVSVIGIDLNYSAKLIKNLKGDFRIPDILKKLINCHGTVPYSQSALEYTPNGPRHALADLFFLLLTTNKCSCIM
jgi:hypothetical protein